MWINSFPFEKIHKDSRVVLYGSGEREKQIYRLITKTNYCKLTLWLDKNADGTLIKSPETIRELCSDDYDYVLISLYCSETNKEITQELIDYGVPREKIIGGVGVYSGCNTGMSFLTVSDFLNNPEKVQECLVKYFYESGGDIDYFYLFIDEFKEKCNSLDENEALCFKNDILNKSLEYINKLDLPAEAKIVLLYLIIKTNCFSKELLSQFVNLTGQIEDNLSFKHWLITDLSAIWYLYPDIIYDEFFIELKELRRSYACEMALNRVPPCVSSGNSKVICAVVNNLNISPGSMSTIMSTSSILNAMASLGYEIHVVGLNSFNYDSSMSIVKPFYRINSLPTTAREEYAPYFSDGIKIHHVINTTMKNRQQDTLDLIYNLKPECIFDFSDEFSTISYYYSRHFPTIYFPLRKQGHSCSSFFHKYVIIQGEDNVKIRSPLTESDILRLPLFIKRIEPLNEFSRKDYGLNKDDIVVITVGKVLNYEMSKELTEQMCGLLRSNTKIKWFVVGCKNLNHIDKRHIDLIGESIIFISHEKDLPGLYGICDIYLNPSRVGGGTSVAWAMQHGLAIASPVTAADGTLYVGKDNSLPIESDLVPHIQKLCEDTNLLNIEKEKFQAIADKWDINIFADKLIKGMNDLIESGGQ
ncbi:MAG: hypothetical protein FWD34_01935 [Oscillospiraceae bacterium]|nr:hypothetical protein [Oscillospiraceae bacterium]